MSRGDLYNLTSFEMCAHNGTHVDAPFHFLEHGATVDQLPLDKTVGLCYVTWQEAPIRKEAAEQILQNAQDGARRILIKGPGAVTAEAARVFAEAKLELLGVESQTVGPEEAPMEVHKLLLSAQTVLLEGLRLKEVEEGTYFLCAAPLCLAGSDGAPCRAFLIEQTPPAPLPQRLPPEDRLQRITRMEDIHDRSRQAVEELLQAAQHFRQLEEEFRELEAYYMGPVWLADREADQAGLVPRDLKRGILSEDAIFDLLTDYDRMKELLPK